MLGNCREWAAFDMAARGLGLVVVPLYANDRADNLGLILQDCGAKLLLVGTDVQWQTLAPVESTVDAAGLMQRRDGKPWLIRYGRETTRPYGADGLNPVE